MEPTVYITPTPWYKNKKVVILIFIILSALIVLGTYLFKQSFIKKQEPPSPEKKLVLRSAEDLTKEIKEIKSKFTDAEGVSNQLINLVNEAKNYQATDSAIPGTRDWVKQSKYFNVFTQLKGQYYATFDIQILELIAALEEFYKQRFPKYYKSEEWKI